MMKLRLSLIGLYLLYLLSIGTVVGGTARADGVAEGVKMLLGNESSHATPASAGLVFTSGRLVPAVTAQVFADPVLNLSIDALLGVHDDVLIGYSVTYNFKLSDPLTVFAGGAYLAPVEDLTWRDAGEKLGFVVGARIKL